MTRLTPTAPHDQQAAQELVPYDSQSIPTSAEAYQLYLKARHFWNKRTAERDFQARSSLLPIIGYVSEVVIMCEKLSSDPRWNDLLRRIDRRRIESVNAMLWLLKGVSTTAFPRSRFHACRVERLLKRTVARLLKPVG